MTSDKPNFLIVIADDLGWADLSSYGAPHIETPNLDRLAADGIRFTDAYAGSATCSPTRLSLLTGGYPGRIPAGLHEPIAVASPEVGLSPDQPTLATGLAEAGYHTAMIGKWHCGAQPWFGPLKSGFHEFFGNLGGALDYFSKVTNFKEYDLREGEEIFDDLRYYTDILSERAGEYILREHDRPWLLSLNYTSPHWPWEGPTDKATSDDLTARVLDGQKRVLVHDDGGSVEIYASMVEDLDKSVGTVLDALEASGQADNTVVLFFSDNGGERYSYQWPLTGEKFSLFEGGIRVPTIVRWPARVAAGRVSAEPVVTMDWTATLLALGGAEMPSGDFDGRDLTPVLVDGETLGERDLFWRIRSAKALRRGPWKYYAEKNQDGWTESLFNLEQDVRERSNYMSAYPHVADELRERWHQIDETLLPYPAG